MAAEIDDFDDDYDDDDDSDDSGHSGGTSAPLGHPRKLAPKTIVQYHGFVKNLRRQVLEQRGDGLTRDVLPVDIVEHLIARASSFRPKTFIIYRCAVLYWLGTLPDTQDVHHARLVLTVGIPKKGFKGVKPKTTSPLYSRSSTRSRTFKRANFDRLIAELSRRSYEGTDGRASQRRATELLLWLKAGLASGLRPIEWSNARWQDASQGKLLVRTAKRKADVYALPSLAGMPAPTEIVERIVTIDPDDRIWVTQHMASVRDHLLTGAEYKVYYDNNRVYLWAMSKDLFGSDKAPFTLYLMRGQFSANRKSRGMTGAAVAAEMGCAAEVAATCYGGKRYGHVSPMADKAKEQQKVAEPTKSKEKGFSFTRVPVKVR